MLDTTTKGSVLESEQIRGNVERMFDNRRKSQVTRKPYSHFGHEFG